MNKIDAVRGIACTEDLDIIGITETWLDTKDKHFLPEVEIDGYTLYHKDREGRKGGGVALYVRNTIHSYIQCCKWEKLKCIHRFSKMYPL